MKRQGVVLPAAALLLLADGVAFEAAGRVDVAFEEVVGRVGVALWVEVAGCAMHGCSS